MKKKIEVSFERPKGSDFTIKNIDVGHLDVLKLGLRWIRDDSTLPDREKKEAIEILDAIDYQQSNILGSLLVSPEDRNRAERKKRK